MRTPTVNAGNALEISVLLPITQDKTGYESLPWVQVRGVRLIGDIGKQYQTGSYHAFGMQMPIQKKYGLSGGSNNIEIILIDDAGQAMLRGAIDDGEYSFKVTRPNNQAYCFTATVSAISDGVGDPKAVADSKLTINYTSPPIRI